MVKSPTLMEHVSEENEKLRAENERLREALKPFADVDEWVEYLPHSLSADELICLGCNASVDVNHRDRSNQKPVKHHRDCPVIAARSTLSDSEEASRE